MDDKECLEGLYQLHWQNREAYRHNDTIFVAQASIQSLGGAEALHEHFRQIIERRRDECPEGWGPMICNSECESFVMAAQETT